LLVYIFSAFVIKGFPWVEVLKSTFTPSLTFSKEQIILICGILGTTISPYLFFWETSQEVEEKVSSGRTTIASRQEVQKKEIRKMRIDVWTGMLFSNLVMFFIVAVCAATLFKSGIHNIGTASDAAMALKPLAGHYAFLLFALGIIGTGLLAIPILAGSASYAVSESFGWKEGLYLRFRQGIYFYGVIIFSMLIGLVMNFVGINPIKALIYAAVANGLVAPLILVLIVIIANNEKIMNSHHNSPTLKFIGWAIVGLMIVAGAATLISFF
jgi:Mn2+/Fe2+ NRAMP family transporter